MILKVPYYSQIKDTKKQEWKNDSCGIAALKMVLDFYAPTNQTIDELYQKGLNIGGYLKNVGWYHHSLAQLAKQFGYKAITRSWNLNEDARQKLTERGFDKADIAIVEMEQLEEGIFTLKQELTQGHPIIVSLPKGFEKNGSGHLVTLIGFEKNGFIANDPLDGEKLSLSFSKFKGVWTKRAILIQKN